jgi:hypothetical protein
MRLPLLVVVATALGCACPVRPQDARPRPLNSLVVEYADLDLTQEPVVTREITCTLEDEAWLFISLQGQTAADEAVMVVLNSGSGQAVALRGPGETMRHVPGGEVTVRLVAENAPRLTRLVVRRVPEIMVYMFEGLEDPSPQQWITHSWDFLGDAILHSTNLIVSPPSDAYADYARAWQERGGRWLINQSMKPLRREGVDGAAYWGNLLGGAVWDGSIHDEVLNADVPLFPRYADALRRFSAMPQSQGNTVYLFCGVNAIGDPTILDFFAPDDATAAEGQRGLRCLPHGDEITTTARQMEVALEPGVEYTLSVSMRTEDCVRARYSGLFVIDEGWYALYGHLPPPEGDNDWTRYEATFTPRSSSSGLYQVVVCGPAQGTMWLDAVQLERGGQATDFAAGERNLLHNPSFEDGLAGWQRGAARVTPLREAVVEHGHVFALEVYIHEQPTEEQAREVIDVRLARTCDGWRRHHPGVESHVLIVLSAGNCTMRYSNDQLPDVSYKALLDLEMHTIATQPAFEGLRGVGFWSGHYIDEEGMRWYGALFRHYCIEGSRERLYDGPYLLGHLVNPGFEDGLAGWEVAGSVEAVPVGDMPQRGARGRYSPVPQGSMVVRTVRAGDPANSFAQPIRDLEPGRLYSLKLYCTDPAYSDRPIPAQIAIEGGELLHERTLDHV